MLIQKNNPVGADAYIQRFQSYLHGQLVKTWNLVDDSGYRCYGRCYRNKDRDGAYVAENYEGGNEYKEVYWDDNLTALSFFGYSSSQKFEAGSMATGVHLVFFVDLSKLKPTIAHRADEEVRKDVLNAVGKGMFGHTLQSVELWIENVLREYPGSRRNDRLRVVDMHPVHCFRLNFSVTYNINSC